MSELTQLQFEQQHFETVAAFSGVAPELIEKNFYVTVALSLLKEFNAQEDDIKLVFSGGTSLSKGYMALERFSEDIDFKMIVAEGTSRTKRSEHRERLIEYLNANGFTLAPEGDRNSFGYTLHFDYPSVFPPTAHSGIRRHIKLEVGYRPPYLASVTRKLSSEIDSAFLKFGIMDKSRKKRIKIDDIDEFLAEYAPDFECVDVVETASDKISALAWRICSSDRDDPRFDPSIIRHLHDLAKIIDLVEPRKAEFCGLVRTILVDDSSRGGHLGIADPVQRLNTMLDNLNGNTAWAADYQRFADNLSYANDKISFELAYERVCVICDWLKEYFIEHPFTQSQES
jgi:hypothetical protein